MEQKIHITDGLPTLSSNYPWLVAQNLKPEGDQIFYSVHEPGSHYRCRIRQLVGRRIRGYFHGWMILSNHPHNVEWSLWNPVTSKFIRLPRLILQDGDSDDILNCCLSSAPDDPTGSILLLTRYRKRSIVFCRLDCKKKRLRWTEISYSEELTSITRDPKSFLIRPTCCNGKVYARAYSLRSTHPIIQICITVKEEGVVIRLLPFVRFPDHYPNGNRFALFLSGSGREMFAISVGVTKEKPVDVCLYKLDMNSRVWIEIKDLKDVVFFVDMDFDESVNPSPAIGSKFGGYIHFLHKTGKVIHSYHVKDKTISLSSMHCLDFPPRSKTWRISVWTMPEITRLQGDNEEVDLKQVEGKGDEMVEGSTTNDHEVGSNEHKNEQHFLNIISFDVLEMIMKFCVGIEYLNFRATCKLCRLAAPMIQWRNERLRLQTYSLVSPWLMELDKDGGIMTFTDPMFGAKYLIKASTPEWFNVATIWCSRYGWLLLYIEETCLPVFYNPFTSDVHELPRLRFFPRSFCFSAPPTSPDCMVVGFPSSDGSEAYIHFVAGEPNWRNFNLLFNRKYSVGFPTCCGRDVYAMFNDGGVGILRDNLCWETIVDKAPPKAKSCSAAAEYFQSKCDRHYLLVVVGEFGESVEVFELNECTKRWDKIDDLGRHMIYISDRTCVCMDAKTPEMENKIYFPRLNCDNGKIVFYSLETCRFHTFNGRNIEQNSVRGMFGTKQRVIYTQTWIEPTWS